MLSVVVDRCVELLAVQPDAVLAATSLGPKHPATAGELPCIAISIEVDDPHGVGLGRFIRAGDALAQTTSVVDVSPTAGAFSVDLRTLQIAPLPLKKNPASLTADLDPGDIQIRNVSGPASPIGYRMVDRPASKSEFAADSATARITFGAAQTVGDKLELTHWTVTWRDDVLGDRFRGALVLDLFANSYSAVDGLVRSVQRRLRTPSSLARQKGFMLLHPAKLDPAESLVNQSAAASPFSVWKQRMSYRFVFEYEEGGELSSAGPIKRVNLDVVRPAEVFSVP